MGISVKVRTYTREVVGSSTHPAISTLCAKAAGTSLPLLSGVDPYDDTTFNRSQLKSLVPELQSLAGDCTPDEREALEEILALTELADRKPHRYLIFNGD